MREEKATSKIEIAKALRAVKTVVPTADYERVRAIIAPEQRDAERVMAGLSEEDEFALLCTLMGTATHLVPLEQRPFIRGNCIVPDFLARFQPGCFFRGWGQKDNSGFNCLVEVKSTEKKEFRIKGSLLQRRRNFAETFGLPLLFAVRFVRFRDNALWVVAEDADRSKTSLKVTIDDLTKGVRRVIWDEYFYMLPPDTYFQASYTHEVTGSNVQHPEYGEQFEFQVVASLDRLLFRGTDAFMFSMFFEAFGLDERQKQVNHGITHVIYAPQVPCCSIADLIYKLNRLPRDQTGLSTYDAAKILALFPNEKQPAIVTREKVETLGRYLLSKKVLYLVGFGEEESHIATWRRYGGTR